jgi:hypothetical protein
LILNLSSNFSKLLRRNLLAILVIAGGYAFLWYSAHTNGDHHYTLCIFKNITGYACPGCGMGRASIELYKGNIAESVHFHWWAIPLNFMVIVSLFWLIRDIFKQSDSYWQFIRRPMKSWILVIIFLLVIVNWIRALYLGL